MKYILSGCTGHLGLNLVKYLLSAGKSVKAIALPGENTEKLSEHGAEVVYGDVTDRDFVFSDVYKRQGVHYVGLSARRPQILCQRRGYTQFRLSGTAAPVSYTHLAEQQTESSRIRTTVGRVTTVCPTPP